MTLRSRAHLGLEAVARNLDSRQIVNGRLSHFRLLDPILEPIRAHWRLVDARNPSFTWALNAHSRLLNVRFPSERTAWSTRTATLEQKLTSYAFADRLCVPRIQPLAIWSDASEIAIDPSWEQLVIKPNGSHSSRAVFLLLQDNRGYLYDLRTGQTRSVSHVKRELTFWDKFARVEFRDPSRTILPILCEPVATGPGGGVAAEFKVFCFYGTVGLVLQLESCGQGTAPVRWRKYYDSDFRALPKMSKIRHCSDDLQFPQDPTGLIDLSVRMSRAVPSPFVRFDFYDTISGPILGEITTASGTGVYPRGIDEHLGALWEGAIARLISDLSDGKKFADFEAAIGHSCAATVAGSNCGEHCVDLA